MIHHELETQLIRALAAVLPDVDPAAIQVRPCPEPRFGDYQASALMGLAKARRMNPRQLAAEVVAKLDVGQWCEPVEIAGPGFLNFKLKTEALNAAITQMAGEERLVEPSSHPRTVVVDFSSPNVAKPMHVGHIRSTCIGDAIQRVLRLLGHRVVTDNHLGDWGTQFGKLIVGWKELLDRQALDRDPIAELERLYRMVNQECEENPDRLEQAREELVKLQAGDEENGAIWKEMARLSQAQFDTLYGRMGVQFDHALGESFYNEALPAVVEDMMNKGIARESEGAAAVFSDGSLPPREDPFLVNRDGEWVAEPALIRKSDGGFNYMTTDLATIDHRLRTWQPDEIVYVVDDRQAPHFRKLFLTFARWQPAAADRVRLRHIGFGKILGEDGRPFKTRSGDTVKLSVLLDEAEERALKVVTEKNPALTEAERREVARVVGIGAIKYADLSPNRQSDYQFSWEKMLSLQGNTGVYLQYAYTRIRSIFRKAAEEGVAVDAGARIEAGEPDEQALAKHLLRFGLTLEYIVEEYRPNYLCAYLYELAGLYSRFYESCPVLKSAEPQRSSRLKLCELAGRVLKCGLNTLGIETLEQM
ncbi:MAG TPA: arginine--tRNA ligase [Verrucomicrobiales bacterium]|nr:arginine--tRNA ligase [Verrucomicrobiales bacterium]